MEYRYEIHCVNQNLGEVFTEESGWYKDIEKCLFHCGKRANGKKLKHDLADNDCPYPCDIYIYLVSDEIETDGTKQSFSSYKILKQCVGVIVPFGYNDEFTLE